jgi:peptide/nickel transport system permease protein
MRAALVISLVMLAVLTLVALAAPLVAPDDPQAVDLSAALSGPTATHFLGADGSGRDILSRLVWGARSSLAGPLAVVLLSTLIGTAVGVISGLRGGLTDQVISRLNDLAFAFPGLIVAILAVAVFGTGLRAPVIALSIAYTPWIARACRGATVVERERPYIAACRIHGMSDLRICLRHILPNVAPVVGAQASINFGYALIDLAGLSYLGLGVQPPNPDWGVMISEGQGSITSGAPEEALFACALVVIAVVAFNVIADAISDRFLGTAR